MKSIKTLVQDIYGLFRPEKTEGFSEESVQGFAERLSRKISTRIRDEQSSATLRLSNVGTKCRRQLWYRINDPESAEPLPPEARIKFLFGDILEELLLWLSTEAGHTVTDEQKEVHLQDVKGHIDGRIDGVLVDCKSASSYSFNKFSDGLKPDTDAFGYLEQLGSYANAEGIPPGDPTGFLVIDKTLGKICFDEHPAPEPNPERINELRKILERDTPPPRDFAPEPEGKSGNERLGVYCSYCPFKSRCYPNLRTFIYSTGPKFLTTVKREPDVPEIK